jgi:hypothetical protein
MPRPQRKNTSRAGDLVLWLIGIMVLGYFAKIITAEVSIWGFLGVVMLWSLFCIRKS